MAIAGLAIYIIFFIVTLGLRSVIQYGHTGSTGVRIFSGRADPLESLASALVAASWIAGILAPTLGALDVLDNVQLLDAAPVHWLGVAVASAGFVLVVVAQLHMGDSWRVGVDQRETTDLVTTGAFAVIRNPIFSAMLLFALGLALMVPNVVALSAFAAAVLGIELQVRFVEEPYLKERHGPSYAAYAASTGRFVPWMGRLPKPADRAS